MKIKIDECPDANGFTTLRPADGTRNGDTSVQPIATVYDIGQAALIVQAVNAHAALVAALDSAAELLQELLRTSASNDQADAIDEVLSAIQKARSE